MLITSSFVLLNVPKSGSSFARAVIKSIYARRKEAYRREVGPLRRGARAALRAAGLSKEDPELFLKELMLPNVRLPGGARDQHGIFAQLPERYRNRRIVSVLRNPFEKLVSDYEFRWWARYPPIPLDELSERFPEFPRLSFENYLRMSDLVAARKLGGENPSGLGNFTIEFVQFFFPEPEKALRRIGDGFVDSGGFRREMIEVEFLHQERLNDELAGFLSKQGFAEEEVSLARDFPKVNETVERSEDRNAHWTPWAIEHVLYQERFLLRMLGQLGHCYETPSARAG